MITNSAVCFRTSCAEEYFLNLAEFIRKTANRIIFFLKEKKFSRKKYQKRKLHR